MLELLAYLSVLLYGFSDVELDGANIKDMYRPSLRIKLTQSTNPQWRGVVRNLQTLIVGVAESAI